MKATLDRAKSRENEAIKPISVINLGDRNVQLTYNGEDYVFPPKTKMQVPACMAWHWLGDPDMKDLADDWRDEQARLASLYGEPVVKVDKQGKESYVANPDTLWRYMREGNIFSPELGRGAEYYKLPRAEVKQKVAQAINEGPTELSPDEIKELLN